MSIHSCPAVPPPHPSPPTSASASSAPPSKSSPQNGYFNAKVSEIAKAAGVADGTIYLYFDGKEDLLITIFREHTRNYLQSLERELANVRRPEERIRIAIRHHLETLGRDRSLAIVAQVELRHSLKFMSLLSQQEVGRLPQHAAQDRRARPVRRQLSAAPPPAARARNRSSASSTRW